MADSILEQIAKKIVERISACPEVAAVKRPRSGEGIVNDHLVVSMLQPNAEPVVAHPGNPPVIEWTQAFQLYCTVMNPEGSDVDDHEIINNFVAEVQKAITQPANTWHNWDGLAINSMFGGMQDYVAEAGAYSGLMLPLIVIYRVDETDPFTSRA